MYEKFATPHKEGAVTIALQIICYYEAFHAVYLVGYPAGEGGRSWAGGDHPECSTD
jgi:hypothetical protein